MWFLGSSDVISMLWLSPLNSWVFNAKTSRFGECFPMSVCHDLHADKSYSLTGLMNTSELKSSHLIECNWAQDVWVLHSWVLQFSRWILPNLTEHSARSYPWFILFRTYCLNSRFVMNSKVTQMPKLANSFICIFTYRILQLLRVWAVTSARS